MIPGDQSMLEGARFPPGIFPVNTDDIPIEEARIKLTSGELFWDGEKSFHFDSENYF